MEERATTSDGAREPANEGKDPPEGRYLGQKPFFARQRPSRSRGREGARKGRKTRGGRRETRREGGGRIHPRADDRGKMPGKNDWPSKTQTVLSKP